MADEKNFGELKRTRASHLAQLTRLYNDLERKMLSYDNVELVNQQFGKLSDRFEQFKEAHLKCLDLCAQPDIVEQLEESYDNSQKNFREFRERLEQWIAEEKQQEEIPDDAVSNASRATSRSSVSSGARLRSAKAKRLIAEHKLKTLKQKHELKRARNDLDMQQQILEQQAELEEAEIEESVWQDVGEEETEVTVVLSKKQDTNVNDNSRHVTTDIPQSNEHDSVNADLRIERAVGSSKSESTNSSIDSAFERLASALQEGFNLPKPELLTFSGKPTDYCKFIKNFEANVESRVPDYQLRLSYLIQYCKGEAKASIEDCVLLQPKEGYEKARSILYSRYGRSHMIVRSYIDNLVFGNQIKASDFESLSKLALDMQKCEITLSQLGYVSDIDNTDNLRKIVKRLPMHLRVKWVDVAHNITETGREPRFADLAKFIDQRSRIATSMYGLDLVRENSNSKNSDRNTDTKVREKVSTFASSNMHVSQSDNTQGSKCICCEGTCNQLELCVKFKSMSLTERFKFVRNFKLCYNCLKGKHLSKDCRKSKACSVENCNFKHHILLHNWVKTDTNHTATKVSINCSSAGNAIKNCLGIIPVVVSGSNGNTYQTYALIDDGADKTLCDERLIDMLDEESRTVKFKMTTAASQKVELEGQEVDLHVRAVTNDSPIELKRVWSVKNLPISTYSAANNRDLCKFQHLSDIDIPEINTKDVLLLIGTDAPEAHIPLEVRSGGSQQPYAVRTRLGWIVRGPINNMSDSYAVHVNFEQTENVLLQQQLERLWTTDFQDQTSSEKAYMSVKDKRALEIMETTMTYEDGHYKLGLPWCNDDVQLPNNLPLAHARLQQLHRKLLKEPKLHEMYTATVNDYIQKGYAKEVMDVTSDSKRVWYLPHHPVTNENKPGKVRVVFDCAARFKDVSLNSQLLQGPDLVNSLVGVLIRFRQDHIALAADVEAMFHQVRVKEDDCDALRFLWWPDGNLKLQPKCYQMQVHLFGATSSPSCAAYALKRTAIDNAESFEPDVASTVDRNFYVDDLLKSVETEEKAVQLATDLREMMTRGGFRLTKWLSNSKTVIRNIPDLERAPSVMDLKSNANLPTDRALGVVWDVNDDAIKYRVKLQEQPITRRGITSIISSIFDPLGLISPIILRGKIMLQDLSRQSMKLGWDDPIPREKEEDWKMWKASLPELETISIPRCFKTKDTKDITDVQLHIFSDGSEIGYGACAYLRIEDQNGKVNCSLLLGKSRLAPLKQTTIPRLELSGAVVACKIYEIVRDELEMKIDYVVFWTDSMILLGYIKNESRRFKTFVANRLSIIHDLTLPEQWRYVDTRSNPADIASRGILAKDKRRLNLWLNGPDFLLKDQSKWRNSTVVTTIDDKDIELKRDAMINVTTTDTIRNVISYFSDWCRLQRSVAWLLRFKKYCISRFLRCDKDFDTGNLSVTELEEVRLVILKHVQQESFSDEVRMLTNQKPVKNDSRLASLNPMIYDGLLRVKGRLDLSATKCPIILPNSHHVTTLIIRSVHQNNGHAGMAQVLASLREKYWILKGPSTVRKVLRQCIRCRRNQAPLCSQKMAPVLDEQKTPDKPPFTFVGIDYFGPFQVKIGRSVVKRYGCLMTCLTTRAVHIEIAHSLTTDSFISAFQRFTGRRGIPEKVYSDNGTNLVSGESELRKSIEQWNKANIFKYMSNKNIQWTFNPPNASHRGGAWERLIRTTRKILKGLVNEQLLTDEQLLTIIAEAERIINDRPLTAVSNDPRDLQVLTPNMLLLMKSNTSIPQGVFNENDIYAKRWWKQIQYLANVFWTRWLREYLPTLQQRTKWKRDQQDVKVDDVVIVADDNTPRGQWPLGRVVEVTKSRDGHVRSCVVKTRVSEIIRPITKLCLLECSM